MRVKCLAQEHNTMTQARVEPRLLDPESNTLATVDNLTDIHIPSCGKSGMSTSSISYKNTNTNFIIHLISAYDKKESDSFVIVSGDTYMYMYTFV